MMQHPPGSTLFPYTTLFRSLDAPEVERGAREEPLRIAPPAAEARAAGEQVQEPAQAPERVAVVVAGLAADAADRSERALRDRKSTRLNSSHANISYAVFCLK